MGKLLAITGPSGAGKSTVAKFLKEIYGIPEMISYTTRPIRKGEIDGVSYHFVTKEEFKNIPMAELAEYNGNFYGTAQKTIDDCKQREGFTCIVCEIEGVKQLKHLIGEENVIQLFIDINKDLLLERFTIRGDTEENINKRLAAYEKDIEMKKSANYIIENNGDVSNLVLCIIHTYNEINKIDSPIQIARSLSYDQAILYEKALIFKTYSGNEFDDKTLLTIVDYGRELWLKDSNKTSIYTIIDAMIEAIKNGITLDQLLESRFRALDIIYKYID